MFLIIFHKISGWLRIKVKEHPGLPALLNWPNKLLMKVLSLDFSGNVFFNIVLDYHFVETAYLGKFLSLSCEPKSLS